MRAHVFASRTVPAPRTRRVALILVLGCLGLYLAAPAMAVAELPDASCPGPADVNAVSGGSDPDTFGQTFTAEHSGTLTRAELSVTNVDPADVFTVEIRSVDGAGAPTATVLATTTATGLPATASPAYTTVSGVFVSPASVSLGTQYALVLIGPDYGIATVDDAGCTGGQAYFFNPGTGMWVIANVGSDRVFATFVTVPDCSDLIDNDLDGAVDFPADTGCADAADASELGTAPTTAPSVASVAPSASQLPDTRSAQGSPPAALVWVGLAVIPLLLATLLSLRMRAYGPRGSRRT